MRRFAAMTRGDGRVMSPRISPASRAGFQELGRMDSFEWNKVIGAVLGTVMFIFEVKRSAV